MKTARAPGGLALAALAGILVITASWWALALWPAGPAVPEWVLRTRDICFGSRPDGLPDAGGWVLLIGEPVGMIGVLVIVWGASLRDDLRRMRSTWRGQLALVLTMIGMVYGVAAVASRLGAAGRSAEAALFSATGGDRLVVRLVSNPTPGLALVDQHGAPFTLAVLRGRPVMVTFAFAHCQTVCPTIVRDLRTARRDARATDAAIVVVTLDPWRDAPARLPSIAAAWGLDGDDRALSGEVQAVTSVLDAWGIPHARDGRTGDITHATTVVLIDRSGRVRYRLAGDLTRAGVLLGTL